jgi:uncharacterized phage-associated protein
MNSYYQQNYSIDQIRDILERIKHCVRNLQYNVSLNENRLVFGRRNIMSKNKKFCEGCRNDVEYIITEKEMESELKGEKYSYMGKEAHCPHCNSELFIGEINDSNLRSLYDVYRKRNHIVPLEMVLEIPQKYNIGKRPLSLLLGWGEQTFSRYMGGDMPTKQYSEILKKIFENPSYYAQILENNKSNIKQATYEKSKHAVESMIEGETKDKSKINLVIDYLLNKCNDITPLALQKALYYIQGFHYAFYNKFIFTEDCEAWVHGPVFRESYSKYSTYQFAPIADGGKIDGLAFSSSEKLILDNVARHICCYSGRILEQFAHSETPWLLARGDLPENEKSSQVISKKIMGEYFVTVKNNYNMVNPSDIKKYVQNMFEQIPM